MILDGFWKNWRELVGKVTLFHEYDQLQCQGHLDALLLDPKKHRGRLVEDQSSLSRIPRRLLLRCDYRGGRPGSASA